MISCRSLTLNTPIKHPASNTSPETALQHCPTFRGNQFDKQYCLESVLCFKSQQDFTEAMINARRSRPRSLPGGGNIGVTGRQRRAVESDRTEGQTLVNAWWRSGERAWVEATMLDSLFARGTSAIFVSASQYRINIKERHEYVMILTRGAHSVVVTCHKQTNSHN